MAYMTTGAAYVYPAADDKEWIAALQRLPDVGRRIEVKIPFFSQETGLTYSTTGVVRRKQEQDPPKVLRFAPDDHPKTNDQYWPNWGFYLTQGRVPNCGSTYKYCSENYWRYIDEPPSLTEEQSMSLYASTIRRKDGYQAAIQKLAGQNTMQQPTDAIMWEGETIHVDDELDDEGIMQASGHDKATKEAQAVLDASMEVYIAAGADIVKGKAKKAAK